MIDGSDTHPGFDNKLRIYHTITSTLVEKETVPYAVPVTCTMVKVGDKVLLGSGEIKPGIRTPHILEGSILPKEKGLGFFNIIVIALYFIVLTFIGFYFSKNRRMKTTISRVAVDYLGGPLG